MNDASLEFLGNLAGNGFWQRPNLAAIRPTIPMCRSLQRRVTPATWFPSILDSLPDNQGMWGEPEQKSMETSIPKLGPTCPRIRRQILPSSGRIPLDAGRRAGGVRQLYSLSRRDDRWGMGTLPVHDGGSTWIQINDSAHQWAGFTAVCGDMRTFGTVYLGTNGGRGIIWGTSAN